MLPTTGVNDQVTAVFELFDTVAVNAWLCAGVRLTCPGVRSTLISGMSERRTLAVLVGSATLVAVTVTVWALDIADGEV